MSNSNIRVLLQFNLYVDTDTPVRQMGKNEIRLYFTNTADVLLADYLMSPISHLLCSCDYGTDKITQCRQFVIFHEISLTLRKGYVCDFVACGLLPTACSVAMICQ